MIVSGRLETTLVMYNGKSSVNFVKLICITSSDRKQAFVLEATKIVGGAGGEWFCVQTCLLS